jgi:hypothetical protein
MGSAMAIKRAETDNPEAQLDRFLDAYTPEVAGIARKALMKLRRRLPFATEMVYDNYNALACGFGPSERVSDVVFSIAVYPKHVNFFFLQGAKLPDPDGLLQDLVPGCGIFAWKMRRRWIVMM